MLCGCVRKIRNGGPFFSTFRSHVCMKKGIHRTEEKRGEQQMKPLSFLFSYFVSPETEIRIFHYPLDPLISPFHTLGGPIDTPISTDNLILLFTIATASVFKISWIFYVQKRHF